ncbi:MAG: WecB/TagA/CpsF family glycosyltransferase [Acidobacteriota bacterium]|nr:WecB/TagA/CpsF family glycosyltransferase [Acidobacteriota bacterium]
MFGIPLHALTMEQVLDRVAETISNRGRLLIGVVNAAKVVNMRRDPELSRAVLDADMILADGMSVVWASRLLRQQLPERVAGIDLMLAMLDRGRRMGWRVYCLGAAQDVLDTAVARMEAAYPGIAIVGRSNGYFERADEARIAAAIRAARPDILLVGMTSPKKEEFLARWFEELEVPVCHGVGGSFDVLAGKVKRAPAGWQRLGLEWLYRVLQEPRRMWRRYLVTNALFCGMLLREIAGRGRVAGMPD